MTDSQYVSLQTITPVEFARSPVGTKGYFFLAEVKGLAPIKVAARVSSRLKSECSRVGSRCILNSGQMLISGQSLYDTPIFFPVIVATISQMGKTSKPKPLVNQKGHSFKSGDRVKFSTTNKPGVELDGLYIGDSTRNRVIIRTDKGDKTIPRNHVQPLNKKKSRGYVS